LTRCVGGIGRKYCVNRPLVPSTWPMQVGTIQFEVIVLEEQNLFYVKLANVFLAPFLQMKVQHLVTNLQILKLGQKLAITSLFNEQQHSSFQFNRHIGGRLDKLWRLLFSSKKIVHPLHVAKYSSMSPNILSYVSNNILLMLEIYS